MHIPAEAVSEHNHLLDLHLAPPVLDGLDELGLGHDRVGREERPRRAAEAEQVEGVEGPRALLAQLVHVVDPEGHAAAEAVHEHDGHELVIAAASERGRGRQRAHRPDLEARVADGHVVAPELGAHAAKEARLHLLHGFGLGADEPVERVPEAVLA